MQELQNYSKIFREYDIRGIFDVDLDIKSSFFIGLELSKIIAQYGNSIGIGYDARSHSKGLFDYLASGINANTSTTFEIYDLGLIPTPVSYFANYLDTPKLSATIMITGSHNPKEYNGFKITINKNPFFGRDITELGHSVIESIRNNKNDLAQLVRDNAPKTIKIDVLKMYQDFLIDHFQNLKNFKYKIAVDAGNGVAGVGILEILKSLNIDFEPLYFEPDGEFPNHHPDPSVLENLKDIQQKMKDLNLKIGLAFDGDADRLRLITQNYIYEGDELAVLFAKEMQKTIPSPVVIGEVKCSSNMYKSIDQIGKSVMYKTGHSNLKVKLKEIGAHLAAEMSGHLFFNDRYFGYDDGIYAGFRALELFLTSSVEEVEKYIKLISASFTTPEIKISTTEERKFQVIERVKEFLSKNKDENIIEIIDIDGIRINFADGFALLRASNTTPCLVCRFEASDPKRLEEYKNKIFDLVEIYNK